MEATIGIVWDLGLLKIKYLDVAVIPLFHFIVRQLQVVDDRERYFIYRT